MTRATKVYRGVSGGVLPDSFWRPDALGIVGGVEAGFMSTTLEREVAVGYAGNRPERGGIVLEIQQGMTSRGADIAWLSQYPHEREILMGPLTSLETVNTRVDGALLVVELRCSVNLTSLTIEQVIGKMKQSHLDLLRILQVKIGASSAAPLGLKWMEGHSSQAQSPEWRQGRRLDNAALMRAGEHLFRSGL